ncbi:polyprenyl synthetase family protein [Chryseobacterium sp. c4a]|uniref:polyprenyl synthetase family protein n=1 Tax=Chryseobacterium sp. c4a TaxID=1573582 RepID=UPI00135AF92A|nr:polyprenyl synthetase family protein [Chryseobacterium sp. c4a]
MNPTIDTILHDELARYDFKLDQAIEEQEGYLTDLEKKMYKKGKRLRPIMLLLSAKLSQREDLPLDDKVILSAVSLEMLHVASLIHDDIIDCAPTRRGYPSIKEARGSNMAVLIGDLQFLQAMRGLLKSVVVQEDISIIEKILKAGYEICIGEIDELRVDPAKAYDDLIEMECSYMNIIDRKTAALFGISCEAGAALANSKSVHLAALSLFGRYFGQSYQIMDDINDFLKSSDNSGKQQHIDLVQKKLSLPIINALRELPPNNALYNYLTDQATSDTALQEAVDAVVTSESFIKTYNKAREIMLNAIHQLSVFSDSPYKSALESIAFEVINGKKAVETTTTI